VGDVSQGLTNRVVYRFTLRKRVKRVPRLKISLFLIHQHAIYDEPLPLDNPLTFYNDASYGMYYNMVHELFPDSPDVEAESSDALVPVVRASPKRNMIP
jgi:hypothetical protein